MTYEELGGLGIAALFIAGWTFKIIDLVNPKKTLETDEPYFWLPKGSKRPKPDRSLMPIGPYRESTLGRILKAGVLIYAAADGNYMAIIVLWMMDHWEI